MAELELWQSLGVALAIGLLIGAERERSKPKGGSPGIRSFALFALVGALGSIVHPVVAAGMVAAVVALLVLSHWATQERDPGLTSEVAAATTLGLGALSTERPDVAVGLGVVVTVLLVSRQALHRFVRETVTAREQVDALKFFVAAFVLLPVLPDGRFGPYDVWVPRKIWLLVVLIVGLGWVGHVATRMLGPGRGTLVTGLAGGFVSGTATTGVMAARARQGAATRSAALAGAALASVGTLVQLGAVTAVVEPRVTWRLLPALAAGTVVLVLETWLLARRRSPVPRPEPDDAEPTGERDDDGVEEPASAAHPFALGPALALAAIISLVLPLALWLEQRYGAQGSVAAAAAGALADVHGASVAVATLAAEHRVSVDTAVTAVAAGLATNTFSKVAASVAGGGLRFTAALLAVLVPGIGVAVLIVLV